MLPDAGLGELKRMRIVGCDEPCNDDRLLLRRPIVALGSSLVAICRDRCCDVLPGQYTAWNLRMSLPITWTRSEVQSSNVGSIGISPIAERSTVVREGVEPDVDDLIGDARNRDPPPSRSDLCPRDTEVRQASRDERLDVV
jgi:hypothetical protein